VKGFFQEGRKAMKRNRTWSQLHQFRIATKKFRYTLELFQPVYGPALDARLEALRKIQKLLGSINDAVNTRKLIADLDHPGPLRKKLAEKAESKRDELRDRWQNEFDAPGELKKWKAFFKHGVVPIDTPVHRPPQQKVRSRR